MCAHHLCFLFLLLYIPEPKSREQHQHLGLYTTIKAIKTVPIGTSTDEPDLGSLSLRHVSRCVKMTIKASHPGSNHSRNNKHTGSKLNPDLSSGAWDRVSGLPLAWPALWSVYEI